MNRFDHPAIRTFLASFLLASGVSTAAAQDGADRYDLLIVGGSVLDGAGAQARVLDVGIRGDRIVALAPALPRAGAARVILASGRVVTTASPDVLATYSAAVARGRKVDALVPAWAREGGEAELRRRAADPVLEDSILRGMVDNLGTVPGVSDLSRVRFSRVSWDTNAGGKTLKELAECRNVEPTPENGARVVLEAILSGSDSATFSVPGDPPARATETLARLLAGGASAADHRVLAVGALANLVILAPGFAVGQAGIEGPAAGAAGIEAVVVNGAVVTGGHLLPE